MSRGYTLTHLAQILSMENSMSTDESSMELEYMQWKFEMGTQRSSTPLCLSTNRYETMTEEEKIAVEALMALQALKLSPRSGQGSHDRQFVEKLTII